MKARHFKNAKNIFSKQKEGNHSLDNRWILSIFNKATCTIYCPSALKNSHEMILAAINFICQSAFHLVGVFSAVSVAFLYFDIYHLPSEQLSYRKSRKHFQRKFCHLAESNIKF